MDRKPFRSALVGVGMAGESHLRAMKKVTGAQLVAVCDSDKPRAQAALAKHGLSLPILPDLQTLFEREQIDVVHIALPSSFHHDAAAAAMERGVHVIVEKPLDITLERIDNMIRLAKERNVRLAGIFQNRYNPAARRVKEAVDAGRFGPITWAGAFVLWVREPKYYQSWRGTKDIDGGGAIMNNSIHSIDLLQWMVGPIESVSAYGAARVHTKLEVEDTMTCALKFASGALGTIVGTTGMFPGKPARIEVGGYNGSAVIEGSLREFKFRETQPGDEEAVKPPAENPDFMLGNLQSIFDAWSSGRDAETNGPECRRAVEIVLAMYESAANGGKSVACNQH
jgi:predicted dehydrogenase